MLSIAVIGCGAVGASVLELLHGDAHVRVSTLVVGAMNAAQAQALCHRFAPEARVVQSIDGLGGVEGVEGALPDLLVECAGHSAIEEHVLPALARGIPCVVVSTGALGEPGMAQRMEDAARAGGTQAQLLSGAIGGIDALAAARIGGLTEVVYTGTKPARAWKGTPADAVCDLDTLTAPKCIFDGSAQEAARLYPKNANVAATLALAGIGLQRTRVQLFADPAAHENVHHVLARGAFGEFELTMRGKPLAANPKTSALTVYSVVRAIRNHAVPLAI